MDNRNDLFKEMPFYMTYPMQNLYLTEMEYEKDMERMKELYPREVRAIQQMIEEYCDQMEHEGSRMYDENPDRRMLEEAAERLLERFLRENPQYGTMRPMPMPGPAPRPMPMPEPMPRPMPRPGMPMPEPMPRPMPMPEQMPERGMRMQEYEIDSELSAQQRGRYDDNRWLRSLIGIMFHDEIYRRRCRNRRCRRWW